MGVGKLTLENLKEKWVDAVLCVTQWHHPLFKDSVAASEHSAAEMKNSLSGSGRRGGGGTYAWDPIPTLAPNIPGKAISLFGSQEPQM